MTKKFEFDWQIPVPQPLLDGCVFDRWTDESGIEAACMFKVDEFGFFIYWKSEGKVRYGVTHAVSHGQQAADRSAGYRRV